MKRFKIYVASSWRNQIQPYVVEFLRVHGHEVYDFRNPVYRFRISHNHIDELKSFEGDTGFHWSEIDPAWQEWTKETYRKNLNHPIAVSGFDNDFGAMEWADVFIGVQPFGRSASIGMGWAAGKGKKTILLLASGEPELMVKVFDHICCSPKEVLNVLSGAQ